MHTKDAAQAGETSVRLNLVAAWREATVFTDMERAALELTEQGTRLADAGGVTDDARANAAKHYDDERFTALVSQIAVINAFNRMNVITQQPGATTGPRNSSNGGDLDQVASCEPAKVQARLTVPQPARSLEPLCSWLKENTEVRCHGDRGADIACSTRHPHQESRTSL